MFLEWKRKANHRPLKIVCAFVWVPCACHVCVMRLHGTCKICLLLLETSVLAALPLNLFFKLNESALGKLPEVFRLGVAIIWHEKVCFASIAPS